MSHITRLPPARGLHERAIDAMFDLIEQRHTSSPDLPAIAETLGERLERLEAVFPDKRAVVVAAAEQALVILIDTCTRAVVRVDPEDPVAQFGAIGDAFLDWAYLYREQFQLVSNQRPCDLQNEPRLNRYVDSIRDLLNRMLSRARCEGRLHPQEDIQLLVLSAISFFYGLARMLVEGRMAAWAPETDPLDMAKSLGRDYVIRIARSSLPSTAASTAKL